MTFVFLGGGISVKDAQICLSSGLYIYLHSCTCLLTHMGICKLINIYMHVCIIDTHTHDVIENTINICL